MARIDSHQGRATADFETSRIYQGLQAWQHSFGSWVDYYKLNSDATGFDDVYEEVTSPGRIYYPPVRLPCLHVTEIQGGNTQGDKGFYMNNDLRCVVPYNLYSGVGMSQSDIDTGTYEMDRIVYKTKVFEVQLISIEGQIEDRPTIVAIDATQLKADQLVEDGGIWAAYSNLPTP